MKAMNGVWRWKKNVSSGVLIRNCCTEVSLLPIPPPRTIGVWCLMPVYNLLPLCSSSPVRTWYTFSCGSSFLSSRESSTEKTILHSRNMVFTETFSARVEENALYQARVVHGDREAVTIGEAELAFNYVL